MKNIYQINIFETVDKGFEDLNFEVTKVETKTTSSSLRSIFRNLDITWYFHRGNLFSIGDSNLLNEKLEENDIRTSNWTTADFDEVYRAEKNILHHMFYDAFLRTFESVGLMEAPLSIVGKKGTFRAFYSLLPELQGKEMEHKISSSKAECILKEGFKYRIEIDSNGTGLLIMDPKVTIFLPFDHNTVKEDWFVSVFCIEKGCEKFLSCPALKSIGRYKGISQASICHPSEESIDFQPLRSKEVISVSRDKVYFEPFSRILRKLDLLEDIREYAVKCPSERFSYLDVFRRVLARNGNIEVKFPDNQKILFDSSMISLEGEKYEYL